ncbi:16S rRNA (adenine(1518)-N(6)/adenine(1519)-N(6))-dimethyltransferaseRsmA [soil metagenome]
MKTSKQKPFAKKSFGQNFLVDQNIINKIISALNPQTGEIIIEIGAGRGALTEKLVESGANVIAIEFEREMITVLKNKFGQKENISLIEQDALKTDFNEITMTKNQSPKPKLVANLPYNIATAILQKLIEQREVFSEMILMFQREVVGRISAQVGSSERGFLSVLTQNYLSTETLFDVPPEAFRPMPKVWSSVMRLKPKAQTVENIELFRKIISIAFAQKRKTILNNLKKEFAEAESILHQCEIDTKRRAETLTLEEWQKICASTKSI